MKAANTQKNSLEVFQEPKINSKSLSIYNANINEKKFKDFDIDDQITLIDELNKWFLYTGISQVPIPNQFVLNCSFIIENWPTLNLTDISNLMNLSAAGKLNIIKNSGYESFNTFGPAYIGKIIPAYLEYKKELIHDVRQEIRKSEARTSPEVSESERILNFQRLLVRAFTDGLEGNNFHDWGYQIYDFIYKNFKQSFMLQNDMIKKAVEYGKKNAKMDKSAEVTKVVIKGTVFKKLDLSEREKYFSREFVVNQWLRQFNSLRKKQKQFEAINKIIESVTIEMLQ